jgi:integrase
MLCQCAEWRIPRTKNGDPQTIPLGVEAVAILESRQVQKGSPFVFPGSGKSGHLEEPKKGWQRILKRAAAIQLVRALAEIENWEVAQLDNVLTRAVADPDLTVKELADRATALGLDLKDLAYADLRLHDLRRTLGSWQAKTGASLSVIGKSLNHRNVSTTLIYARLDQDPVRESISRATAAMFRAGGISRGEADADVAVPARPKL